MARQTDHPLLRLSEEDLNMACSFVLLSGSIKDLAREYGVSYPTMRNRLNGLIERLRRHTEGRAADPLSEYLAQQIARGHVLPDTAKMIRELHRAALDAAPEGREPQGEDDDA